MLFTKTLIKSLTGKLISKSIDHCVGSKSTKYGTNVRDYVDIVMKSKSIDEYNKLIKD